MTDTSPPALDHDAMEAMAHMAGRVAHDLNNILAQVSGLSDLARIKKNDPAAIEGLADRLQETIQRARGLTDALNRCAQRSDAGLVPTDLTQTLTQLVPALGEVLGPDHPLDLHLGAEPLLVLAEAVALREAVRALATNAAEASPEGSEVRIELTSDGHHALLQCCDQGEGMDPATRARACEPFFSTRGRGRKGLGLAVAYGVARRFGGELRVTSEPGAGTTITLALPLT